MRKSSKLHRGLWLLIALLLVVTTSCASPQATAEPTQAPAEATQASAEATQPMTAGEIECPLRLGSVRPETGQGASFGQSLANGLAMGFDEVNAQGGILGCDVEVVSYDSQSVPANAATLTQRLITQDNVPLVIGSSISTESLAMMEITENAQVPLYVPSAASEKITNQGYDWVWRQSVIDRSAASLFAEYIANDLGWKSIGAIYENTDYGKIPVQEVLKSKLEESGAELTLAEAFNPGDADLSGQLLRISDAGVDGLVYWGHEKEAATLLKQNQQLGIDLSIAGNTGIVYPAFLELLPADVQANTELVAVSQFVWTTNDPQQLEWIERFRDRFGKDPDVTSMDGYDAAFVLKKAFEAAGSTENTALQKALNEVEYQGVGGYISFDETGQAVRSLVIAELTPKDEEGFRVIKQVEPGQY